MLILVEGADRTGKTTLCEREADACGGRYLHWDRPTSVDPWVEYVEPIQSYRPGGGEDLWIDRHYLGELVWPLIFKRKALLTYGTDTYVRLERWLLQRGAVGVLAVRDEDELEAAVDADDEPITGHQAVQAQQSFERRVSTSSLPWLRWRLGDEDRVDEVVHLAMLMETAAEEKLP